MREDQLVPEGAVEDSLPAPMDLYPTMDSLQDVLDLVPQIIPATHRNKVFALLGTYHNTLLKNIKP
jgi:hypothetical protein